MLKNRDKFLIVENLMVYLNLRYTIRAKIWKKVLSFKQNFSPFPQPLLNILHVTIFFDRFLMVELFWYYYHRYVLLHLYDIKICVTGIFQHHSNTTRFWKVRYLNLYDSKTSTTGILLALLILILNFWI